MAKEIFILKFDKTLSEDERQSSIGRYASHLQRLGVSRREVEPIIFRPALAPYIADADALAVALKAKPSNDKSDGELKDNTIREADYLAPHWGLPFENANEATACIVAVSAFALEEAGVRLKPEDDAQIVVIAQPELADEFLRLNPNGVAKAHFNANPGSPVFSQYFIEHVELQTGRQLDEQGLTS